MTINENRVILLKDIISCVDNLDLPINEVDWITNEITIRSVVIYDEANRKLLA